MNFLNLGVFLTGVGLVSAPIIIHLLNRRRFKILDWAAMKFLLESIRKNRRRLRIEELILLALRCLVIFMLAMAVGRFTGCSGMGALPGGTRSQATVYLLDDSYSMGQKVGAGTLLMAAGAELGDQINKHSKDDAVTILLTSRPDPNDAFFRGFLVNEDAKKALVARLGALQPSDLRAHLGQALKPAGEILRDEKKRAASRRLFVLSDFRRNDLSAPEGETVRQECAEIAKDAQLLMLDYGRDAKSNLTLQSIELLDHFAVARAPARIRITVRNNGTQPVEKAEVAVKAKYPLEKKIVEQELPVQVFDGIGPGESKSQEFVFTPPQAGSAILTATLPADELPGDNAASLALNVRQAVKVLVVDGKPDLTDPVESESFFFVVAIDPRGDGSHGYRPDVVTWENLGGVEFSEYDLVVLLNLADFPPASRNDRPDRTADPFPQLTALERYVRNGGGLAIFTGDNVNTDFYKKRFYAEGTGLLPFPILIRVGEPRNEDRADSPFFRLDPKTIAPEHMLRCFREEAAAVTNLIRFFAFHKAEEKAPERPAADYKPPVVLARFTDPEHSPAIVSSRYGMGSVMTFYTTASDRWTDWPVEIELGTYVQVILDMISQLARTQPDRKAPLVGEEIVFDLGEELRDAKALLKTPRYPAVDAIALVAKQEEGKKGRLQYPRTTEAGAYTIGFDLPGGQAREVYFARNPDPTEGELAPGRQAEIASALGGTEFKYFARYETGLGGAVTAQAGTEYWKEAIALLLLFLAVETFLGQRFGHHYEHNR